MAVLLTLTSTFLCSIFKWIYLNSRPKNSILFGTSSIYFLYTVFSLTTVSPHLTRNLISNPTPKMERDINTARLLRNIICFLDKVLLGLDATILSGIGKGDENLVSRDGLLLRFFFRLSGLRTICDADLCIPGVDFLLRSTSVSEKADSGSDEDSRPSK